jgi:hypothetical protein
LNPGDAAVVGPYWLLARMAIGGTAVVYLGRSVSGRVAAVKVQHSGIPRERLVHEIAMTRAAAGGYSPALLDADPDAPERLMGRPVKPASDIYALGATLVYASTGSPPNGVPENEFFQRCLDPDPARRPGLAELLTPTAMPSLPLAITNAIQERIDPVPPPRLPTPVPPTHRPRRAPLAVGVAAVVVAVAVGGALYNLDGQPPAQPTPTPSPTPKPAATSRLLTGRFRQSKHLPRSARCAASRRGGRLRHGRADERASDHGGRHG